MISGVQCSVTLYRKMASQMSLSTTNRVTMSPTMGSLDSSSRCIICCGKTKTINVQHSHLSTYYYNSQMIRQGDMTPMCHFCDIRHPFDHRTRQNVILTTSTLSGIQYAEGWTWGGQVPTHCDMEAIPGGKIVTLKKAWERAYLSNPLPIDTVLVAGLEDIRDLAKLYQDKHTMSEMAELISEDVINSIENLQRVVQDHSEKHDVKDTLAVATIVHVPAMYWRDTDGEYPTTDYLNLKEVVDRTNLKIQAFNLKNGRRSAPRLQQAGDRGKPNKRVYMWHSWVGDKKEDMMDLKDPQRFGLARLIIKYFEKGTPLSVQHLF